MAKKRTTALFEAMSRSKSLKPPVSPRSSPQRAASGSAAASADGGEKAASPLETPAWMKKNSAPSTAAERAAGPGAGHTTGETAVETDADRQEVKIRLSYHMVGIVAFGVLITLLLAIFVGKELSNSHTVSTETTPQLLAGPAHPEVLNPPHAGTGGQGSATPAAESESENGQGAAPGNGPTPIPGPGPSVVPTVVPAGGGNESKSSAASQNLPAGAAPAVVNGHVSRVVGLNYLIVQSYPDEAAAKAAVDLLAKNGIPATIERGLNGFPKWDIVVTAQGYPKGSPDTEVLRKKIDQISADQSRKDKKWKLWTPLPYRWR